MLKASTTAASLSLLLHWSYRYTNNNFSCDTSKTQGKFMFPWESIDSSAILKNIFLAQVTVPLFKTDFKTKSSCFSDKGLQSKVSKNRVGWSMEWQDNFHHPTCRTATILDEDISLTAIKEGLLRFLSCLKPTPIIYILTKLRPLLLPSMYNKETNHISLCAAFHK